MRASASSKPAKGRSWNADPRETLTLGSAFHVPGRPKAQKEMGVAAKPWWIEDSVPGTPPQPPPGRAGTGRPGGCRSRASSSPPRRGRRKALGRPPPVPQAGPGPPRSPGRDAGRWPRPRPGRCGLGIRPGCRSSGRAASAARPLQCLGGGASLPRTASAARTSPPPADLRPQWWRCCACPWRARWPLFGKPGSPVPVRRKIEKGGSRHGVALLPRLMRSAAVGSLTKADWSR